MAHPLINQILAATPTTVGELALALHMEGGTRLDIALPGNWICPGQVEDPGYEIAGGQLTFTNLADRNRLLASYIHTQYFDENPIDPEKLFAVVRELWIKEHGRDDSAAGRLLASISEQTDVLLLAAQRIRNGVNVFDVLHVFDAYLIHVQELNVDSLIELALAQHDGTKKDLMAGMLYGSLEKWLIPHPAVALELFTRSVDVADDITANLISVSLVAISRSDPDEAVRLAFGLVGSDSDALKRIGRWICGVLLRINEMSDEKRRDVEQFILTNLRDVNAEVQKDAIGAATRALHVSSVFDDTLRELAQSGNVDAAPSIATALFLNATELQKQERFFCWLPLLSSLGTTEKGSFDGLDHVLSLQLTDGNPHQSEVIGFLKRWASLHSGPSPVENAFAEHFNECLFKMASSPELLAIVITDWLLSDKRQMAGVVAGMLYKLEVSGFDAVALDPVRMSSIDGPELKFLMRRVLGFVHKSTTLMSMGLSLLRMNEEAIAKALPLAHWLFVHEIGYDYPGTTSEALEQAELNEQRPAIRVELRSWREEIVARQSALESLPRRNEFRPPTQLRHQFDLARSSQMELARKKASDESILRQLVTEIPLKAGRGCFNHFQGQFSEPSELHTVSYSVELPRREILDPVGNAYRGFQFRTMKKGE